MIRISTKTFLVSSGAVCCGLALVVVSGCSSSSQESQVSGSVTLDGNRIGPGTVVFAPIGSGTPATGSIDSGGSYSLNTSRESGLHSGKYKATVSIREMPPDIKRGERPQPGKPLIPLKYEDTATSGLEFEVVPGSNTLDIQLKSQSNSAPSIGNRSRLGQGGRQATHS